MAQTWNDFSVVESLVTIDPRRPLELPESGAGALLGWVAGPTHCVGVRLHPSGKRTRKALTNVASNTHETWVEPRSDDDWALISEIIDEYLAEAGVPAQPQKLTWYLVDTLIRDEGELRSLVTTLVHSDDAAEVLLTMKRLLPAQLSERTRPTP